MTYVFVLESGQDFDLPQSPLTVGLVFERRDLFDGYTFVFAVGVRDRVVDGRPESRCVSVSQVRAFDPKTYTTIPYAPSPMYRRFVYRGPTSNTCPRTVSWAMV